MRGGDKSIIGAKTETNFIFECLNRGWDIAKSILDNRSYDFIFNQGNGWKTVQVKTAYEERGHIEVSLRRSSKSYNTRKPYKHAF